MTCALLQMHSGVYVNLCVQTGGRRQTAVRPIRLVKQHQKQQTFAFTAPVGESGLQRTYERDVKMSSYLSVHIYVVIQGGLFETSDLLCRCLLLPHHLLLPQRGLQLLDVAADHLVSAPHL